MSQSDSWYTNSTEYSGSTHGLIDLRITPVSLNPAAMNDFTYDPTTSPPAFGHAMLKYWGFDKEYVNVNHGQ